MRSDLGIAPYGYSSQASLCYALRLQSNVHPFPLHQSAAQELRARESLLCRAIAGNCERALYECFFYRPTSALCNYADFELPPRIYLCTPRFIVLSILQCGYRERTCGRGDILRCDGEHLIRQPVCELVATSPMKGKGVCGRGNCSQSAFPVSRQEKRLPMTKHCCRE